MVRIMVVDDASTGWRPLFGNTKAAIRFAVNSVANETRFLLCRKKLDLIMVVLRFRRKSFLRPFAAALVVDAFTLTDDDVTHTS